LSPSAALVIISTVGEGQLEHELILAEDQNRPTILSPALPPSSALVSSPVSDCPNNDVKKTYDGDGDGDGDDDDDDDDDNDIGNDDNNRYISLPDAECNEDSDGNNDSLSDKNDCDENDSDDNDNDNDEPIEVDNVKNILVPDKEPFKASGGHIFEQSTSDIITLLNVDSDDTGDNKGTSLPSGQALATSSTAESGSELLYWYWASYWDKHQHHHQ
jgi:hypothetical protein